MKTSDNKCSLSIAKFLFLLIITTYLQVSAFSLTNLKSESTVLFKHNNQLFKRSKDWDALGYYNKYSLEANNLEVKACTDQLRFTAEYIDDLADFRSKKEAYFDINIYGISMFELPEKVDLKTKDTKVNIVPAKEANANDTNAKNAQVVKTSSKDIDVKDKVAEKVETKVKATAMETKKKTRLNLIRTNIQDIKPSPNRLIHRILLSSITRVPSILLGAKGCVIIDSGSVTAEMTICLGTKLKALKLIEQLNKFERCRSGDNLVEIPPAQLEELEKICDENNDQSLTLKDPSKKKSNLKVRPGNKWDEERDTFLHPSEYVVPGALVLG